MTGQGRAPIADTLDEALIANLHHLQAALPEYATLNDWYMALSYAVRERLLECYLDTLEQIARGRPAPKVVAYLVGGVSDGAAPGQRPREPGPLGSGRAGSLEGRSKPVASPGAGGRTGPRQRGAGTSRRVLSWTRSRRSAVPAIGYGIRYEFGIFDQVIRDGWQVEITDKWLRFGNPWEIARPEMTYDVKFGGRTEAFHDRDGRFRVRWVPETVVKGVAYDTPIPGYRVAARQPASPVEGGSDRVVRLRRVQCRRLLRRRRAEGASENITKVLYPNDEPQSGKQLRLQQQYLFVSCSLQDMIRLQLARGASLDGFADCWAAQLNDTHPAIAVAELMRLLVDDHAMEWDQAWNITQRTCGYTNHTLLPEALEKWPVPLFGRLLPRHLEIILEINRRFLDEVRAQVSRRRRARAAAVADRRER